VALGGDEVQHMELPARGGEQPGEVPDALEIPDPDGVPVNATDQ
jgi:hypothetical protein